MKSNLDLTKLENCSSPLQSENKKASHKLGENISKNLSDKGLVSKYIKNFYNRMIRQPSFKMGKYLNGHFMKKDL